MSLLSFSCCVFVCTSAAGAVCDVEAEQNYCKCSCSDLCHCTVHSTRLTVHGAKGNQMDSPSWQPQPQQRQTLQRIRWHQRTARTPVAPSPTQKRWHSFSREVTSLPSPKLAQTPATLAVQNDNLKPHPPVRPAGRPTACQPFKNLVLN